ncbi:MAG: NADAR family protein [Bdellovibrio sp.]|nr:NADAR family protein [Bdellovibrio sp.]
MLASVAGLVISPPSGGIMGLSLKGVIALSLIFFSQMACAYKPTPPVPYEGEILDFYSTKDAYGEFSNFANFPIYVDGEWWKTSEHYYQAHKYDQPELIKWVQEAPTAMEAAKRGRDDTIPTRGDWELIRDGVMEKAVFDKFTRYPELSTLLLSTGNARIYEHTKNDCYWADCGDRTGLNKLGLLLEKVRESLKKSAVAN